MLHRQVRSVGLKLPSHPAPAVHHLRRYSRIRRRLDLSEQQRESPGVATESDQVRARETGSRSSSIANVVPRLDHLPVAILREHRFGKRFADLPAFVVTHRSKKSC